MDHRRGNPEPQEHHVQTIGLRVRRLHHAGSTTGLWRRRRRRRRESEHGHRRHERRGGGRRARGHVHRVNGRHRDRRRRPAPRLRHRAARLVVRQLRRQHVTAVQHCRRHRPLRRPGGMRIDRGRLYADPGCQGVDQHGRPGHVGRCLRGHDGHGARPLPRPQRPRRLRHPQGPSGRTVALPALRDPVPRRRHRRHRPVAGTTGQGDCRRTGTIALGPAQRAVHDRHLLVARRPQRPPLPPRVGRQDQRARLHLRPQLAG